MSPGKPRRPDPLDALLRRSGATMVMEHGLPVPVDFGSVAGEVAVCEEAVGIGDRAELVALELHGDRDAVLDTVEAITGSRPEPGLARRAVRAWWCPVSARRLLVLVEPPHLETVAEVLPAREDVTFVDVSGDYAALAIVGPRAAELLEAAGLDVPARAELLTADLAGAPALVLGEAPESYLALVPAARAVAAWNTLHDAGEGLGVGSVGREALDRFAVSVRTRARQNGS